MKFKVKKNLGQHFINNSEVLNEIISIRNIENENIIEIGPGFGALTKIILSKKPKEFTTIEKDENLKPFLDKLFEKKNEKFNIIYGDALKLKLDDIYKNKKIILIANLPYNIATTLIINWLQYIQIFKSIIVMVQEEVADRLSAKTSSKSYGRLSVLIQLHTEVKKKIDVKPSFFNPPPKVSSSVIEIIPKKKVDFDYHKFDELLKLSFKFRRKKIKNNLIKFYPNIEKVFEINSININSRAQDIDPENYLNLYKSLY